MIKSKLVAIVCATTLAVAPALVACGGSSSSDGSNAEPATEEATEGTADENAGAEGSETGAYTGENLIAWGAEGVTNDAKYGVLYVETRALEEGYNMAQLLLVDFEAGTAKNYHGEFTEDASGTVMLMDTMSGDTITYTAPDANPETNEVKMTIDGVGDATLTMIDDVDTVREDIVDAIKANDEAK